MKTIIFVRHAAAEEQKEGVLDISRTLVKEGIKEAKNASKRMKCRVSGNSRSVLFMSSPANRALETAHIFAQKLDYPEAKILLNDAIFNESSFELFLSMIKEIDEVYDTVVLFGHNPSISEWASSLIKGFEFDIPKSGIVALEFTQDSWKAIEKQTGILKYVEYPDEKADEFQKTLSSKLALHISEWLNGVNPGASQHCSKSIEKHTAKIIKKFVKDLNRNTYEKPADK